MKTIKTLALALLIVGTFNSQANAAVGNTHINCVFMNKPQFRIYIQADAGRENYFKTTALAKIVITGPLLNLTYKTILVMDPINTRIKVGVSYGAKLGAGS
ncbi:MAG: hypothetical protein KDD45_02735, partial [Bdellovibrionales bacterium]|nr:hypothetical protein [Bdellovibrionales bacterium]